MTGTAMGTVDYSGYYSRYYSRYYWPKLRYYKSVIKPMHSRYRAQRATNIIITVTIIIVIINCIYGATIKYVYCKIYVLSIF